MADSDARGARSRRFPPRPQSAAAARRFVRATLKSTAGTAGTANTTDASDTATTAAPDPAAVAAPDLIDTAELLVGELVTNAVLHARTEVEVSIRGLGDGIHVRVGDRRPRPVPVPRESRPYAGTGHGLAIVGRLASRYGVDVGIGSKTVWFELWPEGTPRSSPGWGTPSAPPAGPQQIVTLVDMPGALYSASEQYRHALLRELTLAAATGDGLGVRPEDLATAHDANAMISAGMAAALKRRPSASDPPSLPLSLPIPKDAAPALRTLRRVIGIAENAAGRERLLTLPPLPLSRLFRQWLFDQVVGQLDGEPPTAWTLVPQEPGVSTSELVPWDSGHVRTSRVPTIVADDANRILAANAPAAGMLGWNADELIGRPLTTLIPGHLRKRHLAAFTSLLLTGRSRILGRAVPLPALHRDGRLVPIRLVIRTQDLPDGRTVFVAHLAPRAAASVRAPEGGHATAELRESPPDFAPDIPRRPAGPLGELSPLERLSLLADTASVLSGALDLDTGLHGVGRILTERLADWCAIDVFDDEGHLDRYRVVHRAPLPDLPHVFEGRLPPVSDTARGPLARVLRGAGPLLLSRTPEPDGTGDPLDDGYEEMFQRFGAASAIVAPLRARREILGALTVARRSGHRPFTPEDVSLVDDLVRALALGVDNTRLYQDTRNVAERLQRSLLPKLPHVDHLRLAARYAASSTTAQVGGDWYDAFTVSQGTAVIIGDVAGHNLDAAIAMSQLRSMLRGIAIDRREPPEAVLRRLDIANHSLATEATATCVYGIVKGPPEGPWELRYSSAGHPPPLLTTADGDTRHLDEGAGLLLGVDPGAPRHSAGCALPAHSTLLLYTDGLIERRGEHLDDGMARLRRHTAALAREPLDVFCDELLIRLGADNADDLAILAIRPTPPS